MQNATTRAARFAVSIALAMVALAGCQVTEVDAPTIGEAYSADGAEAVDEAGDFERTSQGLGLCDPCTSNSQCGGAGNYCLRRSDGVRFCGRDCRTSSCPTGYSCMRLSSSVSQCVPPNAQCSTSGVDAGPPADAGTPPPSDAGTPTGTGDVPNTAHCAAVANWDAQWRQWEEEVLLLTNQRRAAGATCGGTAYPAVGPLAMSPALRCAARLHSQDMGVNNYFSHTSRDGRTVGTRVTNAGYAWSTVGENIAKGYPSPSAVVTGWMNSTGHCQNIMRSTYTQIGVGYYAGNVWTQNFGRPR